MWNALEAFCAIKDKGTIYHAFMWQIRRNAYLCQSRASSAARYKSQSFLKYWEKRSRLLLCYYVKSYRRQKQQKKNKRCKTYCNKMNGPFCPHLTDRAGSLWAIQRHADLKTWLYCHLVMQNLFLVCATAT